jgi:hypothetical protein
LRLPLRRATWYVAGILPVVGIIVGIRAAILYTPPPSPPALVSLVPGPLPERRDCGPVTEVGSVSALVALAPPKWIELGRSPNQLVGLSRSVTSDIRATVDLEVDEKDFNFERDLKYDRRLRLMSGAPGVSPIRYDERVVIRAGTTFRMVCAIEPFPPLALAPYVLFESSCRNPCPLGEWRCNAASDSLCYSAFEYCLACAHGSLEQCACVASDLSQQPDGTPCEYMMPMSDIGMRGKCSKGRCEP